jgi:hypothetical protein
LASDFAVGVGFSDVRNGSRASIKRPALKLMDSDGQTAAVAAWLLVCWPLMSFIYRRPQMITFAAI